MEHLPELVVPAPADRARFCLLSLLGSMVKQIDLLRNASIQSAHGRVLYPTRYFVVSVIIRFTNDSCYETWFAR